MFHQTLEHFHQAGLSTHELLLAYAGMPTQAVPVLIISMLLPTVHRGTLYERCLASCFFALALGSQCACQ